MNYYTRLRVSTSALPGAAVVTTLPPEGDSTAMGWGVDADGLAETLRRVTREYGDIPLYVTENGAAYDDEPTDDGDVHDEDRTAYLAGHIEGCAGAIAEGVPLRGYFVWSLLDNFEWAHGYGKRFGIVHVDYATQERRVKASGRWYADFIRAHADRSRDTDRVTASPERPTLDQVAARAGVGRGTVSRVINGSSQVSERTRQTVLAAVTELGYVPNLAARALVTRRTDTVALVVSESEDRLFGEPFFAGVVRGISAGVTAAGRQLVLALTAGQDGERPIERYLTRQHVDGVLLLSLHGDDPLPRQLRERGLPVVLGGRPLGRLCGRLRRRRQRRRCPGRGRAPAGAGTPAGRHDHRAAGHDGRPGPARRVPGRAGRGRPAGRGLARGDRRLQRGQRCSRRCTRCWRASPTSTRCSRPTT